jgi:crossover junction endodeoxyribonuclease RusA
MRIPIILVLPYPPSINTYWGFSGHRRFLTKKALEFKHIVQSNILLIPRNDWLGDAEIRMKIILHPPDARKRDIDNVLKPLLDSMIGLYRDDSQIKYLSVLKSEKEHGGSCIVKLYKI